MPFSTPISSAIGLRILKEFKNNSKAKKMMNKCLDYLENTYDYKNLGWEAVTEEVNLFPHAPWWHYNINSNSKSKIKYGGNPTAEILAYFYEFRNNTNIFNIEFIIDEYIKYLESQKQYEIHEIYCFIKLANVLPTDKADRINNIVSTALSTLVSKDTNTWDQYVPKPIDFITTPKDYFYGIDDKLINTNLDYLINKIISNGKITKTRKSQNWIHRSFYKLFKIKFFKSNSKIIRIICTPIISIKRSPYCICPIS